MEYLVKNIVLAEDGRKKISWAESRMPVLMKIRERFEREKPINGLRISACLHVTKETAVLVETLKAGGARVRLCASNPLSTQDDVAAALANAGVEVFAERGQSNEDYYKCLNKCLDIEPNITLDDGADLINTIHEKRSELLKSVYAGQEETTTGVIRLRAMAREGALKYPVIAVNDTPTKHFFDNMWGTAQSTLDAIMRTTNILFAGKTLVVCGFGYCGKGLALRARGLGANVIVTEVDSLKALEAVMHGFRVMPLKQAALVGDLFVTVTGDKNVITKEHFELMKDGVILANSGHFDVEINVSQLEEMAVRKKEVRQNLEEFELKNGRRLYLIARGRLCNLGAAEGHPSEVMDMSFANQALCSEYLLKNWRKLEKKVYDVPKEIDETVSKLKLEALGIEIDELTEEQKNYLNTWKEGT